MSAVKWFTVESSNIKKIGWPKDGIGIFVEFKDDDIYFYQGVSRQRAVALRDAKSVGNYLNTKIKGSYRYERLK